KQKAEALIVLGGPPFSSPAQRGKLLGLAAKTKLPTIYRTRNWVNEGGLMSYGPNALKNWSIVAAYVDEIMKGAKPGSQPVQQLPECEVVINVKTAKTLGLTIPPSVLAMADRVQ